MTWTLFCQLALLIGFTGIVIGGVVGSVIDKVTLMKTIIHKIDMEK